MIETEEKNSPTCPRLFQLKGWSRNHPVLRNGGCEGWQGLGWLQHPENHLELLAKGLTAAPRTKKKTGDERAGKLWRWAVAPTGSGPSFLKGAPKMAGFRFHKKGVPSKKTHPISMQYLLFAVLVFFGCLFLGGKRKRAA